VSTATQHLIYKILGTRRAVETRFVGADTAPIAAAAHARLLRGAAKLPIQSSFDFAGKIAHAYARPTAICAKNQAISMA
jgi:hypothetical protein